MILCGRLASQYGRVTDEGLYQFAIDNELEPDFLKENFEFPGLNMDMFIEGYFDEKIEDNPKEKEIGENIEINNKCPKCGYEWS